MSGAGQRAGAASELQPWSQVRGGSLTPRWARAAALSLSLIGGLGGSVWAEPQRAQRADAERVVLPSSPLDHVLARTLELYPDARLTLWSDEGHFDLSEMRLHTLGVGTPLLLSPTGGLATEELSQVARRDVKVRLKRGLKALRQRLSPPEPSSEPAALSCGVDEATLRALSYARPARFSDGSVHIRASISLRALTCPEPRRAGGGALSIVRLKGSPVRALSQLPRLLNTHGAPLDLSRVRFFRERDQARELILGALEVKVRGLKRHEGPGSFVVQGDELKADEELWVLISEVSERPAERAP